MHISSALQAWDESSALQGEQAAGGWGNGAHRSSQGHLLFLFLSLQYRREGDLKGCPGTIERKEHFRAQKSLGTHSHQHL